jgi:hypothetical protein
MANVKISVLPASTTPLAGTEVLPIVQGGVTKQVSVADLTAGRSVSASEQTLSGNLNFSGTGRRITGDFSNSTIANRVAFQTSTVNGSTSLVVIPNGTGNNGQINFFSSSDPANSSVLSILNSSVASESRFQSGITGTGTYLPMTFYTGGSEAMRIHISRGISINDTTDPGAGNLRLGTGNLVVGTAAKGINFTANTPAAGMTSQLLNWYEEGAWTPAQGAGLTVVGAFSSTGRYTRIGRQVSISGTVTGATTVAVTAAGVVTNNLPFTVVTAGHGGATNAANNVFSTVICTSTNVTSAGAIAATGTITFSATYFV